jgi:hypothetical protein
MGKIFCALPAKRCSISNLGGKAAFALPTRLGQRVPPWCKKKTKKACHLFHDPIQSNPANSTPKKYQMC